MQTGCSSQTAPVDSASVALDVWHDDLGAGKFRDRDACCSTNHRKFAPHLSLQLDVACKAGAFFPTMHLFTIRDTSDCPSPTRVKKPLLEILHSMLYRRGARSRPVTAVPRKLFLDGICIKDLPPISHCCYLTRRGSTDGHRRSTDEDPCIAHPLRSLHHVSGHVFRNRMEHGEGWSSHFQRQRLPSTPSHKPSRLKKELRLHEA